MPAVLDENTQFVDTSGAPVVGGFLYFGIAGADPKLNPTAIFSDRALTVALANPQTTDANGRSTNKVWIPGKYSFRLSTSADVQLYQELDNGSTAASTSILSLGSIAGSNTITGTASTTIAAYTDGQQFVFKTVSINTGAVTLNVDAVGAKSIVKNVSKAILPGDFAANQEIIVVYNSTNDNFDWVNQKRLSNTFYEGAAVAAAATTNIWATDGDTLHITGTTGITSLGTAPNVGARKTLIFDGIVTLTNSANLALPGGANFTTAAGDVLEVYADTTSQIDVRVIKKDGEAVVSNFTTAFTSTGNSITSAGQLVLAHSLGVVPRLILFSLLNGTTDEGYAVNDILGPFTMAGDIAANGRGVSCVADATNITLRFSSNSDVFGALNKTTGALVNLTNTSWTFEARAFA